MYVSDIRVMLVCVFVLFFFFFQAEDGIRDHCVTGVQTCLFRSVFHVKNLIQKYLSSVSRFHS